MSNPGFSGSSGTRTARGTSAPGSPYICSSTRATNWEAERSSTLSATKPLRPTTRPLRTWNTCTAASRSSSAIPTTSMSSGRSETISWVSAALRTAASRLRTRAARSNSRASAASCISPSSFRTTGAVSPERNRIRSSTIAR